MSMMRCVCAAAVGCLVATATAQQERDSKAPIRVFDAVEATARATARTSAAELLVASLESSAGPEALRNAARDAAELLSGTAMAERLLSVAAADPADEIERAMESIADDLAFEPLEEAPVPQGWPSYAPVGEVVLKPYPAYRVARAAMRRSGMSSSFMTLFRHIQQEDIAMTAPVEMSYADSSTARGSGMGFLYRYEEMGEAGSDGDVDVVDVPASLAISIGSRGRSTSGRVEQLADVLEEWLEERADSFEVVGALRVMAYNGPSVFGDRAFFEVEIPVRLVESSSPADVAVF